MLEELLNNKPQIFSYTFKLTNNVSIINLPYPLENCKKLKIKYLRFITGSANNEVMLLKINHFNENVYYTGTNLLKCAKSFPLPNTINTPFIYDGQGPQYDVIIKSRPENFGINSLNIEVLIDEQYKDMSNLNPLYIELIIE